MLETIWTRRSRLGAFSIVETILAFGLLTVAFTLFTRLLVFGLKGMDQGEDAVRAVGIARSELTRLKAFARTNNWNDLLGADGTFRQVDGFKISTEVFEREVYSPSRDWEAPFIGTPEARRFIAPQSSQVQAVVKVRGQGAETVLTTLISRPRLTLATPAIVVDSLPSSLTGNATATVRARLIGSDGAELPGFFRWMILPETGNATVEPSRNGRDALLRNNVATPYGTNVVYPGRCLLRVSTVYFGQEVTSQDYPIDLGS